MKHAPLLLLLIAFFSVQCTKKNTPGYVDEVLPVTEKTMKESTGNFVSNKHPTSGKVSITTDEDGKKFLSFENFKTDNGPDLRVYLAPSASATNYVEAGKLKAVSGNFFYELDPSIDYKAKNHVLIWCEDFSVLFGHAVLNVN